MKIEILFYESLPIQVMWYLQNKREIQTKFSKNINCSLETVYKVMFLKSPQRA